MITAWLQSSDLSVRELGTPDAAGAQAAFRAADWAAERARADRLLAAGRDFCPAGIGFEAPGGEVLHILPLRADSSEVFFVPPPRRSRLWSGRRAEVTAADLDDATCCELIALFYAAQFDALTARLAQGGSPAEEA